MNKLLLALLTLSPSLLAMEKPKRKSSEASESLPITYVDQSAIAPWRIIAFDERIKAGFIDIGRDFFDLDFGHIAYLQVNEGYRGQGIGYELFKRVIFALLKKGFRVITWDATNVGDVPALVLEKIYLNYIFKLKDELEFDFIMDETLADNEMALTPMKIIIKDHGAYPEVI